MVPLLLDFFPDGFELQFATSSVGPVVSCPRLVHSSFLRNLSTTDGEKPYIAAMRLRFEMPSGYFLGILFFLTPSPPGFIFSFGKQGKVSLLCVGYTRDMCGKESEMGLDRLSRDECMGVFRNTE